MPLSGGEKIDPQDVIWFKIVDLNFQLKRAMRKGSHWATKEAQAQRIEELRREIADLKKLWRESLAD